MNKISLNVFYHNPKKVALVFLHVFDCDLAEISQTQVILQFSAYDLCFILKFTLDKIRLAVDCCKTKLECGMDLSCPELLTGQI